MLRGAPGLWIGEHGLMDYRQSPPAPELSQIVAAYWTLTGTQSEPYRVLPDGCADLICDLHATRAPARWVGTMTRSIEFLARGAVALFGVRFRAGGLFALLGAPLSLITDNAVSLDDLPHKAGARRCKNGWQPQIFPRAASAPTPALFARCSAASPRDFPICLIGLNRPVQTCGFARWLIKAAWASAHCNVAFWSMWGCHRDSIFAICGFSTRALAWNRASQPLTLLAPLATAIKRISCGSFDALRALPQVAGADAFVQDAGVDLRQAPVFQLLQEHRRVTSRLPKSHRRAVHGSHRAQPHILA